MSTRKSNRKKEAEELDVLLPDKEVEIGGETVVVREFRFAETLKLTPLVQPLIKEMAERLGAEDSGGPLELMSVAEEHERVFWDLLSRATGKPVEWLQALSDAEGMNLVATFWEVNRDFFTRRLVQCSVAAALSDRSGGRGSERPSAPSSPTATPPNASPGTRDAR